MSQSLSKIIIHSVFSTKNHKKFLKDNIRTELYPYLGGALKQKGNLPIEINGTEDHIHLLFVLSKNISVSKLIGNIKSSSSKWIKNKFKEQDYFGWQNGYACFSVSQSSLETVKIYIKNQQKHHEKLTFKEELLKFFEKYKIDYDAEYVWD